MLILNWNCFNCVNINTLKYLLYLKKFLSFLKKINTCAYAKILNLKTLHDYFSNNFHWDGVGYVCITFLSPMSCFFFIISTHLNIYFHITLNEIHVLLTVSNVALFGLFVIYIYIFFFYSYPLTMHTIDARLINIQTM